MERAKPRLLAIARAGGTDRDAAEGAGIGISALYHWLRDDDLSDFARDYREAKAVARIKSVKVITDSDKWQAHAWFLARMDRANWGDRVGEAPTVESLAEKLAILTDGDD